MKKILLAIIFPICLIFNISSEAAFAYITNYAQLVTALESGNVVRGIIYFKNCTSPTSFVDNDVKQFNAKLTTLGFTINVFNHTVINSVDQVEVSKRFFSISTDFPTKTTGNINNYIRIQFTENRVANVSYQILHPVNGISLYSLDFKSCMMGLPNKSTFQGSTGIVLYRIISDGSNLNSSNLEDPNSEASNSNFLQ